MPSTPRARLSPLGASKRFAMKRVRYDKFLRGASEFDGKERDVVGEDERVRRRRALVLLRLALSTAPA